MDDDNELQVRRTALDVPAQMVMEIAAGMEDPFGIAYKYGYSYEEYQNLLKWKPFVQQVDAKAAELKASGQTFRMMTQWMAEDLAKKLYLQAKDNNASLPQVHDVFKTMAKLADLEPKQNLGAPPGAGFSININFSKPMAELVTDVTPKIKNDS